MTRHRQAAHVRYQHSGKKRHLSRAAGYDGSRKKSQRG